MKTMERKKPRARPVVPPEFKVEIVALVRQPAKSAGGLAREMELTETAVREWAKQVERVPRHRQAGSGGRDGAGDLVVDHGMLDRPRQRAGWAALTARGRRVPPPASGLRRARGRGTVPG